MQSSTSRRGKIFVYFSLWHSTQKYRRGGFQWICQNKHFCACVYVFILSNEVICLHVLSHKTGGSMCVSSLARFVLDGIFCNLKMTSTECLDWIAIFSSQNHIKFNYCTNHFFFLNASTFGLSNGIPMTIILIVLTFVSVIFFRLKVVESGTTHPLLRQWIRVFRDLTYKK